MESTNNLSTLIPDNLSQIALMIKRDWKNVNYAAKPYLSSMERLNSIDDYDWNDSGRVIVQYFLNNAASWKGDVARAIKSKLRKMLA